MPTSIVQTASILGVDAFVVEVEADVSIGLGVFTIVGLPDSGIRESRDRITAAMNNAAVIIRRAPSRSPSCPLTNCPRA